MSSTKKWMEQLSDDFGVAASSLAIQKNKSIITLPSPSLNWAIGNGGIVEGKAMLFYGGESGGKSLLAQLAIIEIQKKYPDGICVWFDAEYSFSTEWFIKLGGDADRLLLKQTNNPLKIFDWMWG